MNIEIENVDLKNSLFADFKKELKNKREEFANQFIDFSAIHYLQGNQQIMKVAFYNQLAEELNDY
jgi:hypothetical protein